jgi:DNA-binding transcriptional ArsR family regulator
MPSFADELGALRARPAEELAADLVRPLRGRPLSSGLVDTDAVRHWARSRGRAVAAVVDALLTDPEEPVRRFLDVLEACWDTWFRAEWEASRDALAARGRQDRDLAIRDGVSVMLRALDSSIDVRDADSVVVQKVQSKRVDVSARSLLLAPSNYVAPHLFLGELSGEPLTIIYPLTGRGPAVPTAAEIRARLEALSSPDRLQVCRAVASEARTAGEIAALWNLHPTQVTRHLRALTRAGLVTPERQGRFVAYRLDDTSLTTLGTDLLTLILR